MFRPFTVSDDTQQQQYLKTIENFIKNNNIKAAALDNNRILKNYQRGSHAGDEVLTNYFHQAKITRDLLARVMSDKDKYKFLFTQLQLSVEQQKANTIFIQSLESKNNTLMKKINRLEKEKQLLKVQIKRIKQIDLNTEVNK